MGRFLGINIPVARILRNAGVPLPKKNDGSSVPVTQKKQYLSVLSQDLETATLVDSNTILKYQDLYALNKLDLTANQKPKEKTWVGGLLGDLFGNVKDGVSGGLKNAGQTLIDKITGKVIGSNGVKGAQDSISDYASGIMESSIAKYLKRNWFYILFPIIGILVFAKFLFNGKKSNRRKRKY